MLYRQNFFAIGVGVKKEQPAQSAHRGQEEQSCRPLPKRLAPMDGLSQLAQELGREKHQRKSDIHQQPGHLFAGQGVGQECHTGP